MTPEEVRALNEGRYEFRTEHSSTKALPYRKTPGQVLVEEFLVPYFPAELSDLSKRTRIPYNRLRKLVRGQDRIDAEIAGKLAAFYRNKPEYWLSLQERYERGEAL